MAAGGAQPSPEEGLPRLLALDAELEANGQLGEAEAVLARALAMAPDNPIALHLSGIIAFRRGRPAEAVEPIERAIALLMPTAAKLFHSAICASSTASSGGTTMRSPPAAARPNWTRPTSMSGTI